MYWKILKKDHLGKVYCLSKIFYSNDTSKQTGPQILSFLPSYYFLQESVFLWGFRFCQSLYFSYSEASCTNKRICHQKPAFDKNHSWLQCLCRSRQRCVARGTLFLAGKPWAGGNFELFQLTSSDCGLQSVVSSLICYWIGFKVALFFWVFLWPGPRVSKPKSQNEKSDWRFRSTGKGKPLQRW